MDNNLYKELVFYVLNYYRDRGENNITFEDITLLDKDNIPV